MNREKFEVKCYLSTGTNGYGSKEDMDNTADFSSGR